MGFIVAAAVDVQLGDLQIEPQGRISPGGGFTGGNIQLRQDVMALHAHGIHQMLRLQGFQQADDRVPLDGIEGVVVVVAESLLRSGAFARGPEGSGKEILPCVPEAMPDITT